MLQGSGHGVDVGAETCVLLTWPANEVVADSHGATALCVCMCVCVERERRGGEAQGSPDASVGVAELPLTSNAISAYITSPLSFPSSGEQ